MQVKCAENSKMCIVENIANLTFAKSNSFDTINTHTHTHGNNTTFLRHRTANMKEEKQSTHTHTKAY